MWILVKNADAVFFEYGKAHTGNVLEEFAEVTGIGESQVVGDLFQAGAPVMHDSFGLMQ